ncbi:MAG: adaptor protein MecA [Clostridia bacterium]|nr:adaptor protein MecA [Clostridia bacterium]
MELIMINSEKIKIMLTREDMVRYDIRMYSPGHTGSAIKEAFAQVLEDVRSQTGFDTLSKRTVLQVYPSRDGGCEVYLTKLGTGTGDKRYDTKTADECKHTIPKPDTRHFEDAVFAFDELYTVLDACRMLNNDGYDRPSSLYVCNEKYYLFLKTQARIKPGFDELIRLLDFSKRIGGRITKAYITEHGEPLVPENAVYLLS